MVLHCFIAIALVVPAGAAWLVGKVFIACSQTKVNYEALSLAPPNIKIPEETPEDKKSNLLWLSEAYNKLNIDEQLESGKTSKKDCLYRLCNWTATKHHNIYPDDYGRRERFCGNLAIYLRGIIKKLRQDDFDAGQRRDLLVQLAEAATVCYPTWMEEAKKIYDKLHNQSQTPEVKLLRYIQQFKEECVLDFCQNQVGSQWHALNFVRNAVGVELGLDVTAASYDPYAGAQDPVFGNGLIKWLFWQKYENVNRLVAAVQMMINSADVDAGYHDVLKEAVKANGIAKPEDYVTENYYDEEYKINTAGVNFLLRIIGVLK